MTASETAGTVSQRVTVRANVGRRRRALLRGSVGPFLVSLVVLLVLWGLAAAAVAEPVVLPSPLDVLARGIALLRDDRTVLGVAHNVPASLFRVLTGWAGAMTLGVLIGGLMASSVTVRRFTDPWVELWRPLPPLAFAPLMVIWLGFGEEPKVLLILVGCMPIAILATLSGAAAADETRIHCARMLGATRRQLFRTVTLPSALPEIMTGARLAAGAAWGTIVAAELLAADSGIGFMIQRSSIYLDTSAVFVGIVLIATLAFIMDLTLRRIEKLLVPWKGKSAS